MWHFLYIVEDLLWEAVWILASQLEAWSDSGVNSEEVMLPTLIGTELGKTDKVTNDKTINEEKETSESNEEK